MINREETCRKRVAFVLRDNTEHKSLNRNELEALARLLQTDLPLSASLRIMRPRIPTLNQAVRGKSGRPQERGSTVGDDSSILHHQQS